jgi:hypothetical protein
LTVVAAQASEAIKNGQVRIDITLTDAGSAPVTGVQVAVPAPAGVTFVGSENVSALELTQASPSGPACAGNVVCTLPLVSPGHSVVLALTFDVAPSAAGSITLAPTISSPIDAVVASTPVTIDVATVPDLVAAETAHGALVTVGNSVVTCTDADPACGDARAGIGTTLDHNSFAMQYVNTAGGTFDSSSAVLTLTGPVSRAVLVWAGDVDQGGSAPDAAAADTVSFSTPSGTTVVTADVLRGLDAQVPSNPGMYVAYADVTALVTGPGAYSVADIQTALGQRSFGGWSLTVIEHDPALPERLLLITAPMAPISSATGPAFGLDLWHPMSNAAATLTAVGFEGDRTLTGDSVALSGCTVHNAFRGSVAGPRSPGDDNVFGTDVLVAPCAGLSGAQLSFGSATTDDRAVLALVAVALDL